MGYSELVPCWDILVQRSNSLGNFFTSLKYKLLRIPTKNYDLVLNLLTRWATCEISNFLMKHGFDDERRCVCTQPSNEL